MSFHRPTMAGHGPDGSPNLVKTQNYLRTDQGRSLSKYRQNLDNQRQSKAKIASESNMFKENLGDVIRFSSKLQKPDCNYEVKVTLSEAGFDSPRENNIFFTINDETSRDKSSSPQPRSFCQPVFEDELLMGTDVVLEREKKKAKPVIRRKGDNSMLSLLLNNPLGEVSKKRRVEGPSKKECSTAITPKISTVRAPEPAAKTLKAVKTPVKRSKTPLAVRDLNTQTISKSSPMESLTSKSAANCKLTEYEVGKVIAKGSYSVVKHAVHRSTNRQVAIKFYDNSKLNDSQKRVGVNKEIVSLKLLSHPHIIGLMDSFTSRSHTCIVMELTSTCTLYDYIKSKTDKKLSCRESAFVFGQLVDAVSYMHSKGVSHRDLKLENIIFDGKGDLKLIDFGFASTESNKQNCFCGTPTYMAPEIIKKTEYLGSQVDTWAMGVILFRLITGTYPFAAKTDRDLFNKICQGKVDLALVSDLEAQACISDMLDVNPATRVTCQQLKCYPFLHKFCDASFLN